MIAADLERRVQGNQPDHANEGGDAVKKSCLVVFSLGVVAGCNGSAGDLPQAEVRLQALQSCGDVEQLLRDTALNEMNRRIDEAGGGEAKDG